MRSSRSSLISSVLLKSTREFRSDTFHTPLLQMRKKMGDSVTCLSKGKKGSLGLSWGYTSGLEDQVGLLSLPSSRPKDVTTARSLPARREPVLKNET